MYKLLLLIITTLFFLSSCMMRKIEYVKDMTPDSLYKMRAAESLKIQPSDRLSITVHSKDSELSAPFNTTPGGYSLTTDPTILKSADADNTFEKGYLVDKDGFINFPTLGKLKVIGLSMEEIEKMIATKIKTGQYIDDPLVKVNLLNFKVIVMGELRNQVIPVPEGRITVFEAIAMSLGVNSNADAQRVVVVREQEGFVKLLTVNLESHDVFNSEAYLLQQNDIVYVAPKYKQVTPGTQSVWQMVGMLFGVVSLSITALALFNQK